MTETLSREVPLVPGESALLFIDVQNFCANREGGEFKELSPAAFEAKLGYYFARLESLAVPNMRRLQVGCRAAGKGRWPGAPWPTSSYLTHIEVDCGTTLSPVTFTKALPVGRPGTTTEPKNGPLTMLVVTDPCPSLGGNIS